MNQVLECESKVLELSGLQVQSFEVKQKGSCRRWRENFATYLNVSVVGEDEVVGCCLLPINFME